MNQAAQSVVPNSFFATLPRVGIVRLLGIGFPLLIGLGFVLAFHFEFAKKHLGPSLDFAATVAVTLLLPVAYALLVRAFEGRWPQELALRPGVRWLALGAAIGFALFTSLYALFTLMGVASWQGFNGFGDAGSLLLLAITAGIGEELIFRGALFRVIEECFGTLVALAVSAALFGAMHAGNPGATAFSSIAIAIEAGLMLAAAYTWSRSLWLPIGIHIAWNFSEGGIYGAAVSGESAKGIFRIALSDSSSPLVTGGAFGPEASMLAVAICLCAGAAFLIATFRSGRWHRASLRFVLARA